MGGRGSFAPSGEGSGWVGSWRAPTTSMPCIGTMNPSGSCHRYGVPPSGGPDRLKPGLQTGGSWKGPVTNVFAEFETSATPWPGDFAGFVGAPILRRFNLTFD